MHIEKRESSGKIKYYLSYSYREGRKVHKFRKYLGLDLPAKLLEERRNIAEKLILEEIRKYKIIQDPLQVELSDREIEFVRSLEAQIPIRISHLSEEQWAVFSILFTYNTNA